MTNSSKEETQSVAIAESKNLGKCPATAGFPTAARLLKGAEFRQVFDKTEFKAQSAEILILGTPSSEGVPRLGLVVSKKSAKLAVDRNRLKRIIRESFRHHQLRMKSLDLVVLTRPGAKLLDSKALRAMLDGLWYKLKPAHQRKAGGRKGAGQNRGRGKANSQSATKAN